LSEKLDVNVRDVSIIRRIIILVQKKQSSSRIESGLQSLAEAVSGFAEQWEHLFPEFSAAGLVFLERTNPLSEADHQVQCALPAL